jgi:hypothetical protein
MSAVKTDIQKLRIWSKFRVKLAEFGVDLPMPEVELIKFELLDDLNKAKVLLRIVCDIFCSTQEEREYIEGLRVITELRKELISAVQLLTAKDLDKFTPVQVEYLRGHYNLRTMLEVKDEDKLNYDQASMYGILMQGEHNTKLQASQAAERFYKSFNSGFDKVEFDSTFERIWSLVSSANVGYITVVNPKIDEYKINLTEKVRTNHGENGNY